jgi:uncharacterized membrane protein
MSDPTKGADPALSKHRLEALSDGVFAVVLTLLVLELKPELPLHADNEAVAHALHELTLPLLGYMVAFAITGVFWTLHHRKFALLRHTDGLHSALTLAFLFAVTLLPLSISIFLRSRPQGIAQALYFGNFALISLTLLASWLYACHAGLADLTLAPKNAAALTRRMITTSALGLIACAAAWYQQMWILIFAMPVILWLRFRRLPTP